MANSEQVIYVDMNTSGVEAAAEDLDKSLLVLRLGFGKLKAAIGDAVAPIGATFIPMVNQAVWAATRMVKSVGKVIGALFGYGQSAKDAEKEQTKLVKSSGKLKRSLMGFDEINRLNGSSGGGSVESVMQAVSINDTLSPQLQAVVDKILSLVAPLKQINFAPAAAAFDRLKAAISPIGRSLFEGLEWAWHNLLVPLAAWTVEDFLPAFLDAISSGLHVLNSVIVALRPMADWFWESFLKPLGQWAGEKVLTALDWLREKLTQISGWISENQALVQKIGVIATGVAAALGLVNVAVEGFNGLGITAIGRLGNLRGAMSGLNSPISLLSGGMKALGAVILLLIGNWDSVKSAASGAWSTIQSVWGNAAQWFRERLLNPISGGFKSMVNGIIGFLNGLISGVVAAINSIVGAVNNLSFTLPGWIPGLGGTSFGFNLKSVTAPRIPYLAQGAVLPANKPFMAVLGDQRHGTNVEAPLTTIQEAVAAVMGDQTAAILAGFEASVEVQREILQAVLGIQIGDEVVGRAVSQYQRKMAVVNGGWA